MGNDTQKFSLADVPLDALREEINKRGFQIHSMRFSEAAQRALREHESVIKQLDELKARVMNLMEHL